MENFYAFDARLVKGFKEINNDDYMIDTKKDFLKKNTVNFTSHCADYYGEKYTGDPVYGNKIYDLILNYIIAEKIDGEFYEVYTGTKIVPESKYINNNGLYYDEYYYSKEHNGLIKNEPILLDEETCGEYVSKWLFKNEERIALLNQFIEESNKNFRKTYNARLWLTMKSEKVQKELANKFIKTLNR